MLGGVFRFVRGFFGRFSTAFLSIYRRRRPISLSITPPPIAVQPCFPAFRRKPPAPQHPQEYD
jgi:hypothetical protein